MKKANKKCAMYVKTEIERDRNMKIYKSIQNIKH